MLLGELGQDRRLQLERVLAAKDQQRAPLAAALDLELDTAGAQAAGFAFRSNWIRRTHRARLIHAGRQGVHSQHQHGKRRGRSAQAPMPRLDYPPAGSQNSIL